MRGSSSRVAGMQVLYQSCQSEQLIPGGIRDSAIFQIACLPKQQVIANHAIRIDRILSNVIY
jgi:hypothetical protein